MKNNFNTHEEKHIGKATKSLRNVRKALVRNSTQMETWRLEDPGERDALLKENDETLQAIDNVIAALGKL